MDAEPRQLQAGMSVEQAGTFRDGGGLCASAGAAPSTFHCILFNGCRMLYMHAMCSSTSVRDPVQCLIIIRLPLQAESSPARDQPLSALNSARKRGPQQVQYQTTPCCLTSLHGSGMSYLDVSCAHAVPMPAYLSAKAINTPAGRNRPRARVHQHGNAGLQAFGENSEQLGSRRCAKRQATQVQWLIAAPSWLNRSDTPLLWCVQSAWEMMCTACALGFIYHAEGCS